MAKLAIDIVNADKNEMLFDLFFCSGKVFVSSTTTKPERVLKIPPKQNPMTPITMNSEARWNLTNFSMKKQTTKIIINGIIGSPLFLILENIYPMKTDPIIAATS